MPKDPTSHWLSKVFRKLKRFGSNLEATEVLKVTGYHKKNEESLYAAKIRNVSHKMPWVWEVHHLSWRCIRLYLFARSATRRHKAPQSATKRHEHTTYHTIILLNFLGSDQHVYLVDLGGLRIESPTNYSNYSTTKLIKSGTAWLRHLVGSSIASRNLKRPHHDWFIGSCWCYSYCRNWNILKYTEILWKWPEYVWINLGIFFFHDIQCTVMLYTLVHLSAALVFSSVSNLELCIRNLYAGRCLIACGAFPALPRCISLLYGNCIILVLVLRVMCMMFAWTHRTCQALTEPQMPNGRELSSDSGIYIYIERERVCVCVSSQGILRRQQFLLFAGSCTRRFTRERERERERERNRLSRPHQVINRKLVNTI